MSTTIYPHIDSDADGVAIVAGTTTKVVEIIQDYLAHRWHADDICRQYPSLTLAQVHAAMTYYYDHQPEVEEDISRRRQRVAEIRAKRAEPSIQNKLHQLGHLP